MRISLLGRRSRKGRDGATFAKKAISVWRCNRMKRTLDALKNPFETLELTKLILQDRHLCIKAVQASTIPYEHWGWANGSSLRVSVSMILKLTDLPNLYEAQTLCILESFVSSNLSDLFKCHSLATNSFLTTPYACAYSNGMRCFQLLWDMLKIRHQYPERGGSLSSQWRRKRERCRSSTLRDGDPGIRVCHQRIHTNTYLF